MTQKNMVEPLVLTSVDATAIEIDTWTVFDEDGIEGACFFLRITNDSDADVFISYDGVDRHEYIAAGDTIDVNFQTNSSPSGKVSKVSMWTKIYVQGTAAQAGNVYLAGYYNRDF